MAEPGPWPWELGDWRPLPGVTLGSPHLRIGDYARKWVSRVTVTAVYRRPRSVLQFRRMRQLSGLMLTPVMLCASGILQGQERAKPEISSCEQQSLARPGFGVSYKGTVRNGDYRFSATIPEGSTGWGAAPFAPFHGFTIYLADGAESEAKSCIVFRIAIHVDLGEDEEDFRQEPFQAERVKVGNRMGWRTSSVGPARGTIYEIINIWLELPRKGYKDDAEIVLVTPRSAAARTKPLFARFLSSFRFW